MGDSVEDKQEDRMNKARPGAFGPVRRCRTRENIKHVSQKG